MESFGVVNRELVSLMLGPLKASHVSRKSSHPDSLPVTSKEDCIEQGGKSETYVNPLLFDAYSSLDLVL